jgi:hypothetical protein
LVILLIPGSVFCQIPINSGGSLNPFGKKANIGTTIREVKYESSLKGTSYLYKDWVLSDIVFSEDGSVMKDQLTKLDIKDNLLEIKDNDQVKVFNANQVYSVVLKLNTDTFITKNTINVEEPDGFFKILYNTYSSLLCHYSTEIKKANYNVTLDVGDRDDEIVLHKTYYAFIEGNLIKIENTRRKLLKQFLSDEKIKTFISENKIDPKKEEDIIELLRFYDTN